MGLDLGLSATSEDIPRPDKLLPSNKQTNKETPKQSNKNPPKTPRQNENCNNLYPNTKDKTKRPPPKNPHAVSSKKDGAPTTKLLIVHRIFHSDGDLVAP